MIVCMSVYHTLELCKIKNIYIAGLLSKLNENYVNGVRNNSPGIIFCTSF